MTRDVHVPYTIEQDEDGVWCGSATLRPGVAAFGYGPTREAAFADLREGLELLIEEVDGAANRAGVVRDDRSWPLPSLVAVPGR